MENHYFEQFLNAKFDAMADRLVKIETELQAVHQRLSNINNVNKSDAVAIENLKTRITLVSSLIGAGVAAFLSAIFTFLFKASK